MAYYRKCGWQLKPGTQYCPGCGTPGPGAAISKEPEGFSDLWNLTVLQFLAILFVIGGLLGIGVVLRHDIASWLGLPRDTVTPRERREIMGLNPPEPGGNPAPTQRALERTRRVRVPPWAALTRMMICRSCRRRNDGGVDGLARTRRQTKIPVVLSLEEVTRFFEAFTSLRHRTILMTAYAVGLRISEVLALRVDVRVS
jgi:hypothetical protein